MTRFPLTLLILLSISSAAFAESLISVKALNYPVWAERGDTIVPLSPGSDLEEADIINTGNRGRAWLSMADGSVIKLGENANFRIGKAGYTEENGESVLDAVFDVVKGAFRFTTGFFNPLRTSSHRVSMNVGTMTAGIRGTDIWGKSTDEEAFIALIEGSIEIISDGSPATTLDEPLSLYRKATDQIADPVTTVSMETVLSLAPETELSDTAGIASSEGSFDLVLMSLSNPFYADDLKNFLQQHGYAATTARAIVDEINYTRVLLTGFDSADAARSQMQRLQEDFALQDGWIKRN